MENYVSILVFIALCTGFVSVNFWSSSNVVSQHSVSPQMQKVSKTERTPMLFVYHV